jgi:hypothetical protein
MSHATLHPDRSAATLAPADPRSYPARAMVLGGRLVAQVDPAVPSIPVRQPGSGWATRPSTA